MFRNLRSIAGFGLALAALPAAFGLLKGIIGGKSGGHVLELVFSVYWGLGFGALGVVAGVIIFASLSLLLVAAVHTAAKLLHRDPDDIYASSTIVDVFFRISLGLGLLGGIPVGVVAAGRGMSVISDLVADGSFWMRVVVRVIVFGYAFVIAWAFWLEISGGEERGPATATSDPKAGSSANG